MARSNGGIIGRANKTSFGKNRVTATTAQECNCEQHEISLGPKLRGAVCDQIDFEPFLSVQMISKFA